VGVEKLFPAKFAKIKSRQEALQATFSVFLDIFYPPNFGYIEENGLFQQLRLLSTVVAVVLLDCCVRLHCLRDFGNLVCRQHIL